MSETNTTALQVGRVVKFRRHHPDNSWMERWGDVVIESIEPDGKLMVRTVQSDGRHERGVPLATRVEEVEPLP